MSYFEDAPTEDIRMYGNGYRPWGHVADGIGHFANFWTFRGLPDIGDGNDPQKNFLLLAWFEGHFRYGHDELAQLIGTSSKTLYRWRYRQHVPKLAAFALLGLCGYRQAETYGSRRRRM